MNKKRYPFEFREIKYQALLPEVKYNLLAHVSTCRNFKFWITGSSLEERLKQPDYRDTYSNIKKLYSCKKYQTISRLKRDLVSIYKDDPRYDNSITRNNDTLKHSREYILYLGWN